MFEIIVEDLIYRNSFTLSFEIIVEDLIYRNSFTLSFETRASPSNCLATAAHFVSWNDANTPDVLLHPCALVF